MFNTATAAFSTLWLRYLVGESYAQRAFQVYSLIERDKEKFIFLVNGRWTDTLFIDGTQVSGKLHSLNAQQSHLYQFNGEITEPKYKDLKIEGIAKLTNGQGVEVNYVIQ